MHCEIGSGSNISSRFFENQLNEIGSHLSEKASKGRLFAPDNSGSKITLTKEKEKRKRKSEEEEGEEKKAMVAHLVFIVAILEIVS